MPAQGGRSAAPPPRLEPRRAGALSARSGHAVGPGWSGGRTAEPSSDPAARSAGRHARPRAALHPRRRRGQAALADQGGSRWLGWEDDVLAPAETDDRRDGAPLELGAAAYVLDRGELLGPVLRATGSEPPPLGVYPTDQVPVLDVAALTGPDLGPLGAADRVPRPDEAGDDGSGGAAPGARRVLLGDRRELQLGRRAGAGGRVSGWWRRRRGAPGART
ncbi:hypothetical protein [Friedmanniella luteola]|uniref:hypothetical protein n=1 Tax=Friedmanniella luteola TaxID=546871 RepID=UPI0018D4376C|nr:hypothetical protein [Friedmanniella luteola]